ncbi:MAG: NYN domain-containing protein [Candidatus Hodarchaeota archaeon]
MPEEHQIIKNIRKLFEDVKHNLIDPYLENLASKQWDSFPLTTRIAFFWDYENVRLPKDVHPALFFEALVPSELNQIVVTKRVYAKQKDIASELETLESYDFEYKEVIDTKKRNATDHLLMTDCGYFCGEYDYPLVVYIIAGDADYVNTIKKLSEKGHDVRLVCKNKRQISHELRHMVPSILDLQEILKKCEKLKLELNFLAQMLSFMISVHPDKRISIREFTEMYNSLYFQESLKAQMRRLKVLLQIPEFKWRYSSSDEGIITHSNFLQAIDSSKDKTNPPFTREDVINVKLGAELNNEKWEDYWNEFKELVPEEKRDKLIREIYLACEIPFIRARLQQKLIQLLKQHQEILNNKKGVRFLIKTIKELQDARDGALISESEIGSVVGRKKPNWKEEFGVSKKGGLYELLQRAEPFLKKEGERGDLKVGMKH